MSFHLLAKGSQDSFDPGFVHTVIAFGGFWGQIPLRKPEMATESETSSNGFV